MREEAIARLQRRVAAAAWASVRYGPIEVFFTSDLDGGGRGFGQRLVPIVADLIGARSRVCEWCSGPGFIGFSLLARQLCERLCLIDCAPRAVAACERTIRANRLADRVTTHRADELEPLPTAERWELVVANPPHFAPDVFAPRPTDPDRRLIVDDPGWVAHRRFFDRVAGHLEPGGSVLLLEDRRSRGAAAFCAMARAGGLTPRAVIVPAGPDVLSRRDLERQELLGYELLTIDGPGSAERALASAPTRGPVDWIYALWFQRGA